MGGGPLRGREESGVVMGEKKKEGVYCVSGQGQRGLIMVWGETEKRPYRIRRRFQIRGSGLIK